MRVATVGPLAILVFSVVVTGGPAFASETVIYTYDALGRLTSTTHSGPVNYGVQSSYSYDPAGNRSHYAVTGVGTRHRAVIVPKGTGYVVIPIGP